MAFHMQLLHQINQLIRVAQVKVLLKQILPFQVILLNAHINSLNSCSQMNSRLLEHANLKTRRCEPILWERLLLQLLVRLGECCVNL